MSGSWDFVLPSLLSVLWKVFDPACFSLTFFPAFLFSLMLSPLLSVLSAGRELQPPMCVCGHDAARWLLFMGPSQLPRPLLIALFVTDWPVRSATVRWVSIVRPHCRLEASPRAGCLWVCAHLRLDSWAVGHVALLAIHTALAAGPWSGLATLERAWASQAFSVITSLLVSLGLHLL